MKRLLHIILCLSGICLFESVHGQFTPTLNEKEDIFITYHVSGGTSYALEQEVRVEYFVHPRWSLLYNAGFSRPVSGTSEYRIPIGASIATGAFSVTAGYNWDSAAQMFFYACMIPDGVAFHVYLNQFFDISPYLNFAGLTYRTSTFEGDRFVYSPKAGLRILFYSGDHFLIGAEQSFKAEYGGTISNSLGASFSVKF